MAHILEFRSSTGRVDCEVAHQHSAQIIIFPGVRIERHAEALAEPVSELADEPQAKPRRRSRPKRDRLELLD